MEGTEMHIVQDNTNGEDTFCIKFKDPGTYFGGGYKYPEYVAEAMDKAVRENYCLVINEKKKRNEPKIKTTIVYIHLN